MSNHKNPFKLLFSALVLVLLFFGLIMILRNLPGKVLYLELFGLFFLAFLTLLGLAGSASRWGEKVMFFVFLFHLLNLVLLWYFRGNLYLILILLALLGFLLNLPSKRRRRKAEEPKLKEELHSVVFDEEKENSKEADKEMPVMKEEKVSSEKTSSGSTVFSPGKYVASTRSNIYHEAKCDWAKKINKARRLWFKSKEEAWEKGYKAHGCVIE